MGFAKNNRIRFWVMLFVMLSLGVAFAAVGYDSDDIDSDVSDSNYDSNNQEESEADNNSGDSEIEYSLEYVDRIFPMAGTFEDFENGTIDAEGGTILEKLISQRLEEADTEKISEDSDDRIALFGGYKKPFIPYEKSPVTAGFQASYRYLGNSASYDKQDGWFDELQGIASDDSDWYLAQNKDGDNPRIFKTSHSEHLGSNFDISASWQGTPHGCTHVGDIDYYKYNGVGIIVAGFEECDYDHARFGFFRASDLKLLATVADVWNYQQGKAPWVSVRNGKIFSSKGGGDVEHILEWTVDWDMIPTNPVDNPPNLDYDKFFLTPPKRHRITNIQYSGDWDANKLHYIQGADFSDDGKLLFVTVGYCNYDHICKWCSPRQLYVFKYLDDDSFKLIRWSMVRESRDVFKFDVNRKYCLQEPEGVSWYDTNALKKYNGFMYRGELQVILLRNHLGSDRAWIKHYTSIFKVNTDEGINHTLNSLRWKSYGDDGVVFSLEDGEYNESTNIKGGDHSVKIVPAPGAHVLITP